MADHEAASGGVFAGGGDLSDRLGPMTVKELRQGMRRVSFVIPFIAIHLLAILAIAVEFEAGGLGTTSDHPGLLNILLLVSSGPFWIVVSLVCCVVMPLGGLAVMTSELEDKNHELLLLTSLTRWQVVWGKFFTLWGMCVLTFVSLLPYVVVRYLVGGIEPIQELACSATLVALSGMVCAGAIGASGFLGVGKRFIVFAVFLASMVFACGPPLLFSSNLPGGFPWAYHLNALVAFGTYVVHGMALARSRVRLVVQSYEVNPSWLILGVIIFTPPAVWMSMFVTIGYGGFLGLAFMALVSSSMDRSPGSFQNPTPVPVRNDRPPDPV